jgi:hypothetical protein
MRKFKIGKTLVMLGHNKQKVLKALSECSSFEDVREKGILFHGTCETLEGPPRGGPYDGVFWTAPSPNVAQAYIPRSGITSMMSEPDQYDREYHMKPDQHNSWAMRWALERAGVTREDLKVEWDGYRAYSWTVPPGWPTMGDLDDYIKSLGYVADDRGFYKLFTGYEDHGEVIHPADWFMPGHLLIILPEGMEIQEPAWSEDALGYANHNRIADFARFSEEGLDAIRMSDQLQSDYWGNVGHEAIGILPSGISKLNWLAIPAVRHDGEENDVWRLPETEEFTGLMKMLNPEYRTRHELEATRDLRTEPPL